MLTNLDLRARGWLASAAPWTNVYGLAWQWCARVWGWPRSPGARWCWSSAWHWG